MSGLTIPQVIELHEDLIADHGGLPGVLDLGKLDSALAQPVSQVFGVVRYRSAVDQAAAYLYYVVETHAFLDGNKRTAIACCLIWLQLNAVRHRMDEDFLFGLTLSVANGQFQPEQISALIGGHLL